MKVGVMLPLHPLQLTIRTRDAAQEIGVDSLWTADHFLGLFHPEIWRDMAIAERQPDPDAYTDPFCLCAALGPSTELPAGRCRDRCDPSGPRRPCADSTNPPESVYWRVQSRDRRRRGRESRALRVPL